MRSLNRAGLAFFAWWSLLLAACGDRSPGTSDTRSDASETGHAGSKLQGLFRVALRNATQAEVDARGVNLLSPTSAEGDPTKQVSRLQTLLAQSLNIHIVGQNYTGPIVPAISRPSAAVSPM